MPTFRFRVLFPALISAALFLFQPAAAQERPGLIRRIITRVTSPSPRLDSAYVFQPRPRWSVMLTNDLRRTGVSQTNQFEAGGVPTSLSSELWERLYKGVGLYAGYGSITLGMSREVGRKSAEYNKSFSFNYQGAGLGAHVAYYDIRQPLSYTLASGEPGTADWNELSGSSGYPGRMKMILAEGLYAFNRSTFSYGSVYKGSKIQRRSAGSWMAGVKFLQGEVTVDPREPISGLVYGLSRQGTVQGSVGAGYSYNFVPYHRDPQGSDIRGLRNLAINLTALPLLTLYDRHVSTRYVVDPVTGEASSKEMHPLQSSLRLNFVTRTGISYIWDRYYLSLAGDYNLFSFRGTTKVIGSGAAVDVKTAGRFSKWSTVLRFSVKF